MATTQAAAVQHNIVQMLAAGGASSGGAAAGAGSSDSGAGSFTDALMANMRNAAAEDASAAPGAGGAALPEGGEALPPDAGPIAEGRGEPAESRAAEAGGEEDHSSQAAAAATDAGASAGEAEAGLRLLQAQRAHEMTPQPPLDSASDTAESGSDRVDVGSAQQLHGDQSVVDGGAGAGLSEGSDARASASADSDREQQDGRRSFGAANSESERLVNIAESEPRSEQGAGERAGQQEVRDPGQAVDRRSVPELPAEADAVAQQAVDARAAAGDKVAGDEVSTAAKASTRAAEAATQPSVAAETAPQQAVNAGSAAAQESASELSRRDVATAGAASARAVAGENRAAAATGEASVGRTAGAEGRSIDAAAAASEGRGDSGSASRDSDAEGSRPDRFLARQDSGAPVTREADASGPFRGFATAAAMIAAQVAGQGRTEAAAPPTGSPGYQQLQQLYRGEVVESTALKLPERFGSENWGPAVSQRVTWMAGQQIGRAELRLDPPDLGSLNIRLSIQHDQASVSFSSPHASVREALEQQMPRLREMLAESGIDLQQSDVSDQSASQQSADQGAEGRGAEGSHQHAGADEQAVDGVVLQRSLSLVDYYA